MRSVHESVRLAAEGKVHPHVSMEAAMHQVRHEMTLCLLRDVKYSSLVSFFFIPVSLDLNNNNNNLLLTTVEIRF